MLIQLVSGVGISVGSIALRVLILVNYYGRNIYVWNGVLVCLSLAGQLRGVIVVQKNAHDILLDTS